MSGRVSDPPSEPIAGVQRIAKAVDGTNMLDGLRTIACYALVVSIFGGLWWYAVLQQRISTGQHLRLPPADPALLRRVRELAGNEDWKERQPPQRASAPKNRTAVTRVENGE
jgi:hypothetical protein